MAQQRDGRALPLDVGLRERQRFAGTRDRDRHVESRRFTLAGEAQQVIVLTQRIVRDVEQLQLERELQVRFDERGLQRHGCRALERLLLAGAQGRGAGQRAQAPGNVEIERRIQQRLRVDLPVACGGGRGGVAARQPRRRRADRCAEQRQGIRRADVGLREGLVDPGALGLQRRRARERVGQHAVELRIAEDAPPLRVHVVLTLGRVKREARVKLFDRGDLLLVRLLAERGTTGHDGRRHGCRSDRTPSSSRDKKLGHDRFPRVRLTNSTYLKIYL
ncbi:hypothetical protein L810_7333 [Burkholderia sp. AU4i]|nr:hypothetical protein L810_7333 [Burkholderia sp. AU4i]